MANEVAVNDKNELTFSKSLTNSLAAVQDGLPQNFNITRFVNNAVSLLNGNEQLATFAKKNGTTQIRAGLMKAAFLGLDALNSECYLIPYGSTLNFMVDYRGAKKLAKKYSTRPIKEIYAKIVRDGDEFEESIVNGEPSINFKPKTFNDGEIIGAFAVALFTDGGMVYDTMSIKELENTRKHSKASNSPAWRDFTSEMYKKTVLHRLCKQIELDFESTFQRDAFMSGLEIETDPEKQAAQEIAENANQIDFSEIVDEVPYQGDNAGAHD